MSDASLLRYSLGLSQGLDGCWLQIAHFITGEETAEMQGRFFETVVLQPLAHPADHRHIIVHPRDHEVCQFDPHARIAHGEDGLQHGFKMSAT